MLRAKEITLDEMLSVAWKLVGSLLEKIGLDFSGKDLLVCTSLM